MNPNDFDPGPLADARLARVDGNWTLVFVRRFRHSPQRVWEALTDPRQLAKWAPFEPDRDLGSEGAAVLSMRDGEAVETHPSEVRRAIRPVLLEYSWGPDLLRWELEADGTGTKLTLNHTVESPEWIPRTAAGWHLCLVVAERRMDGEDIGPIVGHEAKKYGWEQLHDGYAKRLGVEGKGWPEDVLPAR